MGMEIEKKVKVELLEAIAGRLREAGAEYVGEVAQRDVYLDDEEGSLRKSDRGLRVRVEQREGTERVLLTYKGPREKAKFKRRAEIEVEVRDAGLVEKVFGEMGYGEKLVVEKNREIWRMGGCLVCLDDVQLLGTFAEIEGPDDEAIEEVAARLGLAELEHIGEGYAAMTRRKLESEGRQVKTF
jgi:adenylate cyclase class 2